MLSISMIRLVNQSAMIIWSRRASPPPFSEPDRKIPVVQEILPEKLLSLTGCRAVFASVIKEPLREALITRIQTDLLAQLQQASPARSIAVQTVADGITQTLIQLRRHHKNEQIQKDFGLCLNNFISQNQQDELTEPEANGDSAKTTHDDIMANLASSDSGEIVPGWALVAGSSPEHGITLFLLAPADFSVCTDHHITLRYVTSPSHPRDDCFSFPEPPCAHPAGADDFVSIVDTLRIFRDSVSGLPKAVTIMMMHSGNSDLNPTLNIIPEPLSILAGEIALAADADFIDGAIAHELLNKVLFIESGFQDIHKMFIRALKNRNQFHRLIRGYGSGLTETVNHRR